VQKGLSNVFSHCSSLSNVYGCKNDQLDQDRIAILSEGSTISGLLTCCVYLIAICRKFYGHYNVLNYIVYHMHAIATD